MGVARSPHSFYFTQICFLDYRVLKGPGGVQGEGLFLGNQDAGREYWGTLWENEGNHQPPLKNLIKV